MRLRHGWIMAFRWRVVASGLVYSLSAAAAPGQVFTIADGNAQVKVDPDSAAGLFEWTVDGVDQVGRDWYWFRTDLGGEVSIDTLGPPNVELPFPGFARVTYTGNDLSVRLSYEVAGGGEGSGESSLTQSIRIQNVSQRTFTLNFFRLGDYDLGGTPGDDTGEIFDGIQLIQSDGSSPFSVESIMGSLPERFQLDLAGVLVGELTDGSPTVLNKQGGPLAGDIASAFQYERALGPGQVLAFSVDSRVTIPEPSTVILLVVAFGAVLSVRRRLTN